MKGKSGDSMLQRWTPAGLCELLCLRANRKSHGKGAATSSADGNTQVSGLRVLPGLRNQNTEVVTCDENTAECMSTGERQSMCVILHGHRVKPIIVII